MSKVESGDLTPSAYVNGKVVPRGKAVVSIDDHGFLYGDGIYETLRVYAGKVFQLKGHLRRLKHSADGIQLKLPLSQRRLVQAIEKTVRANHLREAVVRLTVTRGPGPYGFDPRLCKSPTLTIVSYPFKPYPRSFHTRGVTVGVVSIQRNHPRSLPPHVKSTSCMNGVLAKMESIRLGAFEGVMLTGDGFLTEGTVSNIFLVKNGVVKTPALRGTLLAGVTRDYVLKLARRLGIKTMETQLRLNDLVRADEVFLSNTTMEVMPVNRLILHSDPSKRSKKIQINAPGVMTYRLMKTFRNGKLLPL